MKKFLLPCVVCLLVLFFIFRPVCHLTTDDEIIQFIHQYEALWPSVFDEVRDAPNANYHHYDPSAPFSVRKIFFNSTITWIAYDQQDETYTFASSEFDDHVETDEYLAYAPDADILEFGKEQRIYESEWHLEQLDHSTIKWISGRRYMLVKMLLPDWYHIYCYLPT